MAAPHPCTVATCMHAVSVILWSLLNNYYSIQLLNLMKATKLLMPQCTIKPQVQLLKYRIQLSFKDLPHMYTDERTKGLQLVH